MNNLFEEFRFALGLDDFDSFALKQKELNFQSTLLNRKKITLEILNRQTGRTTKMLINALVDIANGNQVTIETASEYMTQYLITVLAKYIEMLIEQGFHLNRILLDKKLKGKVFKDHWQ